LVKDVCRASYGVNICWRQRRRSPIDWLRRRLCPVVCYFCEKIATFSTAWRSRKRRHANRKRLDHRAPDDSRGQQPMGAALRDARSLRSTASFAARKWTLLSCGIDCPSQGPPGSPNSTHTQATRPPCLDLSASAPPPPHPRVCYEHSDLRPRIGTLSGPLRYQQGSARSKLRLDGSPPRRRRHDAPRRQCRFCLRTISEGGTTQDLPPPPLRLGRRVRARSPAGPLSRRRPAAGRPLLPAATARRGRALPAAWRLQWQCRRGARVVTAGRP